MQRMINRAEVLGTKAGSAVGSANASASGVASGSVAGALIAAACALLPAQTASAQSFVNWESPHVHPLDRTPDGLTLLAVNTADARLEVFALNGTSPVLIRSVPVGLEPISVRARTNDEAWVVNHLSDSISIVDIASGRVVRTLGVGDEPADVVFAGNPQRAFITLSQPNRLVVHNAAAPGAPLANLLLEGEDPRALAASADGTRVVAAIFESGNHTTAVQRAGVTNPNGPYGGENPPPNSGTSFDPPMAPGLPDGPPVAHIVRKVGAQWLDANGRNWSNFVTWDVHDHDVAIVDANTFTVSYATGLMTTVAGIAVRVDGTVTAVGTEAMNDIRFESNVNGIFIRSRIASFPITSPGAATISDLNPHLDYSTSTVAAATRHLSIAEPRAIIWSPDGAKAYAAGLGSNNVIVTSASGARERTIDVGAGPTGLAISADGSRLWVLNRFDASITQIETSDGAASTTVPFHDATPVVIRTGRPFLFDAHLTSGLGQASCTSCHIDTRTDHLAWDLGDPSGAIIDFDGACIAPGACVDWHPMKGPLVTQTLQGIIGNEPFHWRGEKHGLEEFNPAFTNLQGADAELSGDEMFALEQYVATITYPPNPNRNIDNTLRTAVAVTNGNGNAQNGINLFNTLQVLPGGPGANTRCVDCHPQPTGTSLEIGIPLGPVPQNRKTAQLRNMHEKTGANRASMSANRGFGFNHDSEFATLPDLMAIGFQFVPGPPGAQQRRDIEAYVLSFAIDTHAGVGAQTTAANGGGAGDDVALISQFITLASGGQVALVVKGRVDDLPRGWMLVGGAFQSDRAAESIAPAALLELAAPGSELTYTLVPVGTRVRLGVDRDEDGWWDRDEVDAGSDPADPQSVPGRVCAADLAGNDGIVDGNDLGALLGQWGSGGSADLDGNGTINGSDLGELLGAWGDCP